MDGNVSEARSVSARWQRIPLYQRILGGVALGVLAGALLGPRAAGLALASKLVLRALGALAPPLILVSIMKALLEARFEPGTAGRLIRLLLLNTLVAIGVGLCVANLLQPGSWTAPLQPAADSGGPHTAAPTGPWTQLLDNVPISLLGPLTDHGSVLGVIFWGLAFGLALRRSARHTPRTPLDWLELVQASLVVILHWVIAVLPLAVLGLVASLVGCQGFGPFRALGAFVVAVLVALLLQTLYYLARVRLRSWVRPRDLLTGCRDALVMAFSTGSSTVTMPLTYQCLRERVGLRARSASLGALVGANFNNDGTALYEALAALFVSQLLAAQGLGHALGLSQQLLVVLTSVAASVGAAGIPEAGLVTMTMVFQAVGLPTEYIALLLPVDWFLDRCRTAINVLGDMNVSCVLDGGQREQAG